MFFSYSSNLRKRRLTAPPVFERTLRSFPRSGHFGGEVPLVGDFGITDSRFTKPHTQSKVETLSARARGLKESETQEDNPEGLLADLNGHVELRNGIATLTNISFSVPGALAHMHGTYNLLNEKVDFHGTLKTESNFTKMSGGGVKSVLLKPFDLFFKKEPVGAGIPVKLVGTYSDAHPGVDLVGKKK